MPPAYTVRFLPEERAEPFSLSNRNVYRFADGSRLSMHTTPAWCRDCQRVTACEHIDSLQEIDRQIAGLNDPDSKVCTQFAAVPGGDELLQGMREDALRRRRWRETRCSPPKCTRCGSSAIVAVPIGKPFRNPDRPGTIEIQLWGIYTEQMGEGDANEYFTPEGDRITAAGHADL